MMRMYAFFKQYMNKEKEYFVDDADFQQFYERTTNERLRNVFVFYILSSETLFNRFIVMTMTDPRAALMLEDLYLALQLSKRSMKTRAFAKYLLNRFFTPYRFVLLKDRVATLQMKKYLESFILKYQDGQTPESPEIAKRMKEIDLTKLV